MPSAAGRRCRRTGRAIRVRAETGRRRSSATSRRARASPRLGDIACPRHRAPARGAVSRPWALDPQRPFLVEEIGAATCGGRCIEGAAPPSRRAATTPRGDNMPKSRSWLQFALADQSPNPDVLWKRRRRGRLPVARTTPRRHRAQPPRASLTTASTRCPSVAAPASAAAACRADRLDPHAAGNAVVVEARTAHRIEWRQPHTGRARLLGHHDRNGVGGHRPLLAGEQRRRGCWRTAVRERAPSARADPGRVAQPASRALPSTLHTTPRRSWRHRRGRRRAISVRMSSASRPAARHGHRRLRVTVHAQRAALRRDDRRGDAPDLVGVVGVTGGVWCAAAALAWRRSVYACKIGDISSRQAPPAQHAAQRRRTGDISGRRRGEQTQWAIPSAARARPRHDRNDRRGDEQGADTNRAGRRSGSSRSSCMRR